MTGDIRVENARLKAELAKERQYPEGYREEQVAEWLRGRGYVVEQKAEIERLRAALKNLMNDVLEYERVNNLSANPGKQDCWQSVTAARRALEGKVMTDPEYWEECARKAKTTESACAAWGMKIAATERERCVQVLKWFANDDGRLMQNDISPIIAAIRKGEEDVDSQ